MPLKAVQFVAIVLTALTLIPAGAHFFEMPHKITMTQAQYFTVQGIYRGWSLFGIAEIGAIAFVVILAVMLRWQRTPFRLAVAAVVCLVAALAIFFAWTYPANLATQNWTVAPDNWMSLRLRWEYAHAAGAVLSFAGFCALVLSALATRD